MFNPHPSSAHAAVISCNDVDRFVKYFYSHHDHHNTTQPSAAISSLFSLIDIGARSALSATSNKSPSCFPATKNEAEVCSDSDHVEPMEDFHVTCEQGVGDGPVAQVADGVFSGLVLLQQLQTSTADGDDHEAFVRDIYSAAGKLKMAEELGFVTSLAGTDPPDKAIKL